MAWKMTPTFSAGPGLPLGDSVCFPGLGRDQSCSLYLLLGWDCSFLASDAQEVLPAHHLWGSAFLAEAVPWWMRSQASMMSQVTGLALRPAWV